MNQLNLKATIACLGAFAMLSSGGCYVRTTARTSNPPPQQPQQGTSGVTVVESTCQQGAQEICNGLDDNCNGQIDEGCGYQSGDIQVTLAWNTGADLDLYVYDPTGARIYYQQRTSPSGGQLDQDARGVCQQTQPGGTDRVENVYWNNVQPPSGLYRVEVHYYASYDNGCSRQNGPTTATLSIAVGGQVIGAYNYTLSPDERATVATFEIP